MSLNQPAGGTQPHSAHWLGQEFRNAWWDREQLQLIARRLELGSARNVLDVGCGVAHWTFLLAAVLDDTAQFTGIDREPEWISKAGARAAERGLEERMRFEVGDATELPFEDDSFDLVTCQTVLMHLADPRAAIAEMIRVTKPGGTVVAVEVNNRVAWLLDHSVNAGTPIEDRVDVLRFGLMCERGKAVLGEGHEAVGSLVPGYLAQAGLLGVQTMLSQRAPVLNPPYESEQEQAVLGYIRDPETWIGPREMRRRYFLAAGGSEAEFEAVWERRLREHERVVAAIDAGSFHMAGGFNLLLSSGRKPS